MPPRFPPNRGQNPMNVNRDDGMPTWLGLLLILAFLICIFVIIPAIMSR